MLQKSNFYFVELEKRYKKCNDVLCTDNEICCENSSLINEIEEVDFNKQIETLYMPFMILFEQVSDIIEEQKPDCERNSQGVVTILNKSINPYDIYNGQKLIVTLVGNSSTSFNVSIGSYNFKAVQQSGFTMYATVNNRKATIQNVCDKVLIEVGFED